MDKIQNRILELIETIEKYNYHYFGLSESLVSDQEYDLLFEELKSLEEKYPQYRFAHSPTQHTGKDSLSTSPFQEIAHTSPILSLNKVYSLEALTLWAERIWQGNSPEKKEWILEPKIDGFSVVLHYQEGRLIRALSRGDGIKGSDITANIKTIAGLPHQLSSPLTFSCRGEVYIEKQDFLHIQKHSGKDLANPRNYAAGVIRRIDPQEVASVPLKIWLYDAQFENLLFETHQETLIKMKSLHLPVNPLSFCILQDSLPQEARDFADPSLIDISNLPEDTLLSFSWADLPKLLEWFQEQRPLLPYQIDGLVFKMNLLSLRQALGFTKHHPRGAMALKFESPTQTTTVLDVLYQVGRTGRVTPTAILAPVVVSGSTIQRATLHNLRYMQELGIGKGDLVVISKRGDVIPAVEMVLQHVGSPFRFPSHCPSCQEKLMEQEGQVFCTSPLCPAQWEQKLIYFIQVLDIKSIGKATAKMWIEKLSVHRYVDLFTLQAEQIMSLEGFGDKKIQNFFDEIEKVKQKPFLLFVEALGIPHLSSSFLQNFTQWKITNSDAFFAFSKEWSLFVLSELFCQLYELELRRESSVSSSIQDILDKIESLSQALQNKFHETSPWEENIRALHFRLDSAVPNENSLFASRHPLVLESEYQAFLQWQESHLSWNWEKRLAETKGVGEILISKCRESFLVDSSIISILLELTPFLSPTDSTDLAQEPALPQIFASLSFVITGSFQAYPSRKELESLLTKLGGEVKSSISRQTSVLICGENAGSKLEKAKEWNIPIWTEEILQEKLSSSEAAASDSKASAEKTTLLE